MEIISSLNEIEHAAKKIILLINKYNIFAFTGELGAGKTTFIASICKLLGVPETVTSPTYSLIQEYQVGENKIIYHLDLYRIKSNEEAADAGVEDCLYSNELCFVEWPEKAPLLFPDSTVYIFFQILSDDKRKLIVQLPQ